MCGVPVCEWHSGELDERWLCSAHWHELNNVRTMRLEAEGASAAKASEPPRTAIRKMHEAWSANDRATVEAARVLAEEVARHLRVLPYTADELRELRKEWSCY